MAKTGAEICSDALLIIVGVAGGCGVDIFVVDAFSTEVGGAALIVVCVAFIKRLGLRG